MMNIIIIGVIICAAVLNAEGGVSLREKVKGLQKGLELLDEKISSSVGKLTKQRKKDMKNKGKHGKRLESLIGRKVNEKMADIEEVLVTLDDKIASMEKRIRDLEEENAIMKQSIILFHRETKDSEMDPRQMVEDQFPEEDADEKKQTSPNAMKPSANNETKPSSTPLLPVSDVSFNVTKVMPKSANGVSILVASDERMTQISLEDPSLRGTIKTDKFVESIAYDSVSERIFWSSNRPQRKRPKGVFSARLDGSGLSLLLFGKRISSLAVDGVRQIVFMADWTSSTISRMSTTGRGYKVVGSKFNTGSRPKALILGVESESLFISFTSEILTMKYDGENLKRLARGIWIKPMALDPANGVLYFSDKRNLYGLDLQTSKKVLVNQLNHDINSMVFYSNKLYMSYQSRNASIDILHLSDNSVRPFTFVRGEWFRMCLIPAST